MRKIFLTIIIVIFIIITGIVIKNKIITNNEKNKITIEEGNIENNIQNKENIGELNVNVNNTQNMSQESIGNVNTSSLPDDTYFTVSGVHKTFNQEITAKINIAYLLGEENITESTNFEDYINKNLPKNGIYVSNVTGYKKTDNPYDFIKNRTDIMKDMLSSSNLTYNIDKNNNLIDNKGNKLIEKKINKLISGDKKIIIAFIPEYYLYINDIDNNIAHGGFNNLTYVSLQPYNNIYTYICDCNSITNDDFYSMMEEISQLAD